MKDVEAAAADQAIADQPRVDIRELRYFSRIGSDGLFANRQIHRAAAEMPWSVDGVVVQENPMGGYVFNASVRDADTLLPSRPTRPANGAIPRNELDYDASQWHYYKGVGREKRLGRLGVSGALGSAVGWLTETGGAWEVGSGMGLAAATLGYGALRFAARHKAKAALIERMHEMRDWMLRPEMGGVTVKDIKIEAEFRVDDLPAWLEHAIRSKQNGIRYNDPFRIDVVRRYAKTSGIVPPGIADYVRQVMGDLLAPGSHRRNDDKPAESPFLLAPDIEQLSVSRDSGIGKEDNPRGPLKLKVFSTGNGYAGSQMVTLWRHDRLVVTLQPGPSLLDNLSSGRYGYEFWEQTGARELLKEVGRSSQTVIELLTQKHALRKKEGLAPGEFQDKLAACDAGIKQYSRSLIESYGEIRLRMSQWQDRRQQDSQTTQSEMYVTEVARNRGRQPSPGELNVQAFASLALTAILESGAEGNIGTTGPVARWLKELRDSGACDDAADIERVYRGFYKQFKSELPALPEWEVAAANFQHDWPDLSLPALEQ